MITRGRGRVVPSSMTFKTAVCSTGDYVLVAGTASTIGSTSTGVNYGTQAAGMIDLLTFPEIYNMAEPFMEVYSTIGTTDPSKLVQISVRLQHAASSAGGDLGDYNTGSTGTWPVTRTLFTTAETTAMVHWTTQGINVSTNPGGYNLDGAKRFILPVGQIVTSTGYATSTSTAGSVDNFYVSLGVRLGQSQPEPPANDACSTSTSTST